MTATDAYRCEFCGFECATTAEMAAHQDVCDQLDECPAGGEHTWTETDTGDSGQRPYRFVICDECGATPPPPDPDDD